MADHCLNGSITEYHSGKPPFDEAVKEMKKNLDDVFLLILPLKKKLQEVEETLTKAEEEYKKPKEIGKTKEELIKTENTLLPLYRELSATEITTQEMIVTINDAKILMASVLSELNYREQEQRREEAKFRLEIEDRRFLMEFSTTSKGRCLLEKEVSQGCHRAMIHLLQKRVQQSLANLQILSEIRGNYEDAKNQSIAIEELQESILQRLTSVLALMESYKDAISRQDRKIRERQRTEGKEGESSEQQTPIEKSKRT